MRRAARTPARGIGAQPTKGLVEVLRDGLSFEQALVVDAAPGLDMLLVTEPYFSPEDLFGDGRMNRLLADVKARYGLIVLDLPPVLGLADARTVAVQADAVAMAPALGIDAGPGRGTGACRSAGGSSPGHGFHLHDGRPEGGSTGRFLLLVQICQLLHEAGVTRAQVV